MPQSRKSAVSTLPTIAARTVRPFAFPLIGVAVASSWIATLAVVFTAGSPFAQSMQEAPTTILADGPARLPRLNDHQLQHLARKSARHPAQPDAVTATQARFDAVVAAATLSPQKVAAAFAAAGLEKRAGPAPGDAVVETADHAAPASLVEAAQPYIVALATPLPEEDSLPEAAPSAVEADEDMLSLPDTDLVPLPTRRPQVKPARVEKPEERVATRPAGKPARQRVIASRDRSSDNPRLSSAPVMAYASPTDGEEGVGKAFKKLFNNPTAGNGVAVYDISAATVTMPDGTVLEAHSGIGASADNPAHVHKKMRGPTPPDTYNLVMRERRFHGVEAIRLLPADGKVKHNRTGLLAHSYLLRGGRPESHGCVAFKNYDKFLKAFKQGKVKRLVVVS